MSNAAIVSFSLLIWGWGTVAYLVLIFMRRPLPEKFDMIEIVMLMGWPLLLLAWLAVILVEKLMSEAVVVSFAALVGLIVFVVWLSVR